VSELSFSLTDAPERDTVDALWMRLIEFNATAAGPTEHRPMLAVVRDPSSQLVGGACGSSYWGWLHLELLWVAEEWRGQGHGGRLLTIMETEAVARGATRAFLDSFDFQAIAFYTRRGYRVFGELPDFPPGHHRCWLVKTLTADCRTAGDLDAAEDFHPPRPA
jgi:GNAT superfamily N-acetyltransferase